MLFSSTFALLEEIKHTLSLDEKEYNELKQRAKQRYGKEVFSN